MDSLTCELDDVDENKKHGMYLLLKNVVAEVVKWGCIQELMGRLAERSVTQDEVLGCIFLITTK